MFVCVCKRERETECVITCAQVRTPMRALAKVWMWVRASVAGSVDVSVPVLCEIVRECVRAHVLVFNQDRFKHAQVFSLNPTPPTRTCAVYNTMSRLLTTDQLLGVKQLPVHASSNLVDHCGFKVHKH